MYTVTSPRPLTLLPHGIPMPQPMGHGLEKWQIRCWKYRLTGWSRGHEDGYGIGVRDVQGEAWRPEADFSQRSTATGQEATGTS